MTGYSNLNALIGAFQASENPPSIRPFDLADDKYVQAFALLCPILRVFSLIDEVSQGEYDRPL